uniref:EF-hand domain-containing protein n=1 Tax=Haptolina brevifila TaxID=156173 RepID=A0A7S2GZR2_9EUKA|mmetsp:Transcript_49551/g.98649  ORF Transcript_49551/g.98649 Transcript_49551/m.98649 type:complete len:151 (+) Transcript_49551:2-454(+)
MAQTLVEGEKIPADELNNMAAATVGAAIARREGASPDFLSGVILPCFMVLKLRNSPNESAGITKGAESDTDIIFDAVWETSKTPALRKCFELFDVDGSGRLSKEELKAILTRGPPYNIDHESADQIIAQFDTNGDGQIDIDEFVKVMENA